MENIFKELKKKIENYKKILEVNTVEVDNSEVSKIEDEIKTLKSKIDELNASMEGKSKIEKMKITLNVSSIESEISLKEMDLEEKKEKVKNEYEDKVKSHNSELEETKKDIENFITDSEDKIENNIKNSDNLILPENSHKFDTVARSIGTNISRKEFSKLILLGTDLEEVKGYYDNIMKVELPNLENIRVKLEASKTGDFIKVSSAENQKNNFVFEERQEKISTKIEEKAQSNINIVKNEEKSIPKKKVIKQELSKDKFIIELKKILKEN